MRRDHSSGFRASSLLCLLSGIVLRIFPNATIATSLLSVRNGACCVLACLHAALAGIGAVSTMFVFVGMALALITA